MGFNGAADRRRRRDVVDVAAATASGKLQWGRRSSSAESPWIVFAVQPLVAASMGPPIVVGGEAAPSRTPYATERLQWGRRSSSAERQTPGSAAFRAADASM